MRDVSKLDRKRPYGVVTGHPVICFVQENRQYRFDGTLIDDGSAPVVAPPSPEPQPTEEELQAIRNKQRSEKMREIWARRKSADSTETE